ncbi:MAG: protease-associated domain protein, partial [Verrucomicrobiales bacterium]|nr:protease-associated domain protein [Verrucomicrobiales bacterium]
VASIPADGASALTNAAAMAGNIALIDRGAVTFATKIKNAQNAGAVAVIIAQNAANADAMPILMGGDAAVTGITIPGVMISKSDGDALKALIASPTGLTVKYGTDESTTLGKADVNTTTLFSAAVSTPGLYPMRLINFEGGGGASVEWYSIDDTGVRHLINDPNDPFALQSYSAVSSGTSISLSMVNGSVVIQFSGILQSSPTLSGFTDVPGATSPYTVPAGSPGRMFFRARP